MGAGLQRRLVYGRTPSGSASAGNRSPSKGSRVGVSVVHFHLGRRDAQDFGCHLGKGCLLALAVG